MEGKKLRICVINNTGEENPSYVVRNKIVADKLREMGHEIFCQVAGFPKDLDIDAYDCFLFNRFYQGSLLPEIQALKEFGKVILYETDDNYEGIDQSHPFHKMRDDAVLSSRELVKNCDGVIVSTPELKNELHGLSNGKECIVIPNSLDLATYRKRKGKNKRLRIGWQGSNIHSTDLLLVMDAVADLQKEFDFDFYIFGIDDNPLKKLYKFVTEEYKDNYQWTADFKKLYEKLQTMKYTHIKTVPYEKYRRALSDLNLDIGLVPLVDSRFNRSKSCLKFYEYAAVGTVSLASNVIPYNQEMAAEDLVKNRYKDWYRKLKRLIEDESYRAQRLYEQEAWVNEHRDLDKVKLIWEETFNNLINKAHENGIDRTVRI